MARKNANSPQSYEQPRLEAFTDRDAPIDAFNRLINIESLDDLRVLVYYGVGGIGKSTLVEKLHTDIAQLNYRLKHPSTYLPQNPIRVGLLKEALPYAYIDFKDINTLEAGRDTLVALSVQLAKYFKFSFYRFGTCLRILREREGDPLPPLFEVDPAMRDAVELGLAFLPTPVIKAIEITKRRLEEQIHGDKHLQKLASHFEKPNDLFELLTVLGRENTNTLSKLVERFCQDLTTNVTSLPKHPSKYRSKSGCRAVLFLDNYEKLWQNESSTKTDNAKLLDRWVSELAEYCLGCGILVVISGRERLTWDKNDWPDDLIEYYKLDGLNARDAQTYLSSRSVGAPPDDELPSPLQNAIIKCCNTEPDPKKSADCHLLYLYLCSQIALNTRIKQGFEAKPEVFLTVPNRNTARELTSRFLQSLHNPNMESWLKELALTPCFDYDCAIALSNKFNHGITSTDWEELLSFSFVTKDADSFYRLHRTMCDVLPYDLDAEKVTSRHTFFADYWQAHEPAVAFYHRWRLDSSKTISEWMDTHEQAIKESRITDARELLGNWAEISLDESEQKRIGGETWAFAHNVYGYALWKTPILEYSANLLQAINHYEAALRVRTEADYPAQWAMTQNNLANAYGDLPTDKAENLRRAIACYEAALRVYTEADYPAQWAMTQNNLAIAYGDLPTDKAENLRRAIACYEAALRVRTEADYPADWATTQNNLAIAYRNLPTGDKAENLRRAIACFEAALRVYTEADYPAGWATTQNNLAIAYGDLPTGDKAENLSRAIACYEAALRVRTEADYPADWATTQNNLAVAYSDLPTGDKAENLRRAIVCYEAALRVYTEADYPADWAATQNNLANAYSNLPTGDKTENLRRAIVCYEAALRVRTEADYPADWAATQNNLANAYSNLPTGDKTENLRRAIACYEAALRVRTEADYPADWAMTQNNLAVAYSDLPTGDKAENLRRAIVCYEAALRVRTEADYPADWAATQYNLAIAYSDLPTDKTENLRRTIACYEAALRVSTEADYPAQFADTCWNLAIVMRDLFKLTENRGLLVRAIEKLEGSVCGDTAIGDLENARMSEEFIREIKAMLGE